MNIKLLREIQTAIREEPRRLNMNEWIETGLDPKRFDHPPCGTTACIAGFAVLLTKADPKFTSFKERAAYVKNKQWDCELDNTQVVAQQELGLTERQTVRLFFVAGWPMDLRESYIYSDSVSVRAQAACERIDRFIASEGEV